MDSISIAMLCFLVFIVIIIVVIPNEQKHSLEKNGKEAEGLIIGWKDLALSESQRMAQSISFPIIEFTTGKGEEITGKPIIGIAESEEPINVSVTILYNPENPSEFMLKRKKG